MFLHCTLHQCVLLVPFYSPLGNVFWLSREECHNAWDIFMMKLWCRCRCRNIALQHITNPPMHNNSFCCSTSRVQRSYSLRISLPKKKSRIATGCHSNHNTVPIHRNHDKRISRLSTWLPYRHTIIYRLHVHFPSYKLESQPDNDNNQKINCKNQFIAPADTNNKQIIWQLRHLALGNQTISPWRIDW
jgi:hypothetical protein